MKIIFIVFLFLLLLGETIFASQFLNIVPDVRSSGMGCVNNGISQRISSLYLNPAGLANIEHYEIYFSHLMWPMTGFYFSKDFFVQYEYLCYARKTKKAAFGINLSHYHQPDIVFNNKTYSIYSGFSSITHAYNFYGFLKGARIKIIWEVLGDHSGTAFAMDFGTIRLFNFAKLYKENTPNFQLGMSVYNIGTPIVIRSKRESLPSNLQVGFSYIFLKSSKGHLSFANDYKYFFGYNDRHKTLKINNGVEYIFMKLISLRLGYIFSVPVSEHGYSNFLNKKFTFGAGIRYKISVIELISDYSYIRSLTLEEYHTHSISITFSKIKSN